MQRLIAMQELFSRESARMSKRCHYKKESDAESDIEPGMYVHKCYVQMPIVYMGGSWYFNTPVHTTNRRAILYLRTTM